MSDQDFHPILKPDLYEVLYIGVHPMLGDFPTAYLDITLSNRGNVRRLRFFQPTELQIGPDFTGQIDAAVFEIGYRQLDRLNVEFGSEEMGATVSFKAFDVIDLDA